MGEGGRNVGTTKNVNVEEKLLHDTLVIHAVGLSTLLKMYVTVNLTHL